MKAWVYPAYGDDATGALNDPDQPYKSIQKAIDALQAYLETAVDPGVPEKQGLVWCMPGLYGPTSVHGSAASGDSFPIYMRHGVHVRGVGARRCVIRGVPTSDPAYAANLSLAFWPATGMQCSINYGPLGKQVLVSFARASQYQAQQGASQPPPWAGLGEVDEILDGFTLQGGDVQVAFRTEGPTPFPASGRVSNCIFDMRHGYPSGGAGSSSVDGPYLGLLMEKLYVNVNTGVCGYFEQRVHLVNNTFVMSEYAGGWTHDARPGAVGVVDVTYARTDFVAPVDRNWEFRGLGSPGLQNNVFRTRPANQPANSGWMAMLGIDAGDTQVRDGTAGGAFVSTNAFAPGRAGSSSLLFRSVPVVASLQGFIDLSGGAASPPWLEPVYYDAGLTPDCSGTLPPTCIATQAGLPAPGVPLWNGGAGPFAPQQVDPAFVGEYLVSLPSPNPVLSDYADWRLVPGSPLVDQGRLWGLNEFANSKAWADVIANPDSPCDELRLDRWDGEGYGNPRTHGAFTDIGFDEVGLYVMAGSYANGDTSHNRTTLLNPSVGASQPERRVLVPAGANGQTFAGQATLRIKGAERAIPGTIPPWVPPAWTRPPYTLAVPLVNPSLPAGFQTAWINMSVERWSAPLLTSNRFTWGTVAVPGWINPFQLHRVHLPPDDEGPGYYSWLNTQVEVDFGNPSYSDLWSNLQAEYR